MLPRAWQIIQLLGIHREHYSASIGICDFDLIAFANELDGEMENLKWNEVAGAEGQSGAGRRGAERN